MDIEKYDNYSNKLLETIKEIDFILYKIDFFRRKPKNLKKFDFRNMKFMIDLIDNEQIFVTLQTLSAFWLNQVYTVIDNTMDENVYKNFEVVFEDFYKSKILEFVILKEDLETYKILKDNENELT